MGAVCVAGSAAAAAWAYRATREAHVALVAESQANFARALAAYADRVPPETPRQRLLEDLRQIWLARRGKEEFASELAIIGPDGRLLVHTFLPNRVGGESSLRVGKRTGLDLIRERADWAGPFTGTTSGVPRVLAVVYSSRLDGLVSIHVPMEAVLAQARRTSLPWAAAMGAFSLLLLPFSLWLIHRALVGWRRALLAGQTEARQALHETTTRLRTVITGAPLVLWATDREGVFTLSVGRGLGALGLAAGEVVGRSIFQVYRDHPEIPGHIRRALAGEEHSALVSVGGMCFDTRYSPLVSAGGEVAGMIGVATDVTERKQAEDALRGSLAEKEMLLRELHHRVKNNLQLVTSLLSLQADRITDPVALAAFKESQGRVRAMALLHDSLYRSSALDRHQFGEYVKSLVAHLFRLHGVRDTIAYAVEIEEVRLGMDLAIPCGLVIHELVTNALLHGFPAGTSGRLAVRLRREGLQALLEVADTGTGMPEGVDPRTTRSLGLSLVRSLVDQLRGTVEVRRGGGTTVRVAFPVRPPSAEERS